MRRIRARFENPYYDRNVRLHLYREAAPGKIEYLAEDGTWNTIDEGVVPPTSAGLPLPPEAVEAIALAAAETLGNKLPSQAEVAVLREMLTKEQGRVDAVLADATLMPRRSA